MSGIMSGITPRRGYADGPTIPGTPMVPIQNLTEQKPWWGQRVYDWLNPSEEEIVARINKREQALNEPIIKSRSYQREEAKKAEDEKKRLEKQQNQNLILKDQGTGEGTGQSDLESVQDYMKMFEAAGASDPKSKWLELAKFGSNILAQPGGDLTGAIGKAATSSIEGLSKAESERKAARLMGLKVGVDQVGGGEIGKKIRTLSRLTGVKPEKIARKFISGDSDFDKEYLAAAEAAGVELGQARKIYLKSIKVMADKNPDIAARLNKPFPKKNPVEGEYYVLPNGKFTRWVKGEKLKPSDPGFYDEEA
jgi:hypothetical protein